jgi:hypothetical protein
MQGFVLIQKLYMLILYLCVNRVGSSCEYENEMTAMKTAGRYFGVVGLPIYFGILAYVDDRLYMNFWSFVFWAQIVAYQQECSCFALAPRISR